MKKFLSLDWDYFINADSNFRNKYFPDGGAESFSDSVKDVIWGSKYSFNPNLKDVKVKEKEYKFMCKMCKEYVGDCLIVESHKHIYDYILNETETDEAFEVINVDFHHDMYEISEDVTCGNWVRMILAKRPNMIYKWLGHHDSQLTAGRSPFKSVMYPFDYVSSMRIDDINYLFICRSDLWSPPHLDPKFKSAVKSLYNNICVSHAWLQQDILKNRKIQYIDKERLNDFILRLQQE